MDPFGNFGPPVWATSSRNVCENPCPFVCKDAGSNATVSGTLSGNRVQPSRIVNTERLLSTHELLIARSCGWRSVIPALGSAARFGPFDPPSKYAAHGSFVRLYK